MNFDGATSRSASAWARIRRLGGSLDAGIECHARQIDAVGVMGVDLIHRLEFVGPERDIAPRAAQRLGEGGPPRAAAKHAHALKDLPRGGRRRRFRICAHDPMPSLARGFAAPRTATLAFRNSCRICTLRGEALIGDCDIGHTSAAARMNFVGATSRAHRIEPYRRLGGSLDAGIECHARQIDAIGVMGVDLIHRLEFVGPERDIAPRAAQRLASAVPHAPPPSTPTR